MSTFVIAECGSSHDGDYNKARELVRAASWVGADAAKFQYVSDVDTLVYRRKAEKYRDAYRVISFPTWWLKDLAVLCQDLGLEFMCTTYLTRDIAEVAPWVNWFKVASFEAGDRAFIEAHQPYLHEGKKGVIVSTGMMSAKEAEGVPQWCDRLHCVSAYPTPLDALNLRVLEDFDGLSDHTTHPLTGAVAVGAGARIIEAHLRLETTDPSNPDYPHARTPAQFKEYVSNIRAAEVMMGTSLKRCQDCEADMAQYRVERTIPHAGTWISQEDADRISKDGP